MHQHVRLDIADVCEYRMCVCLHSQQYCNMPGTKKWHAPINAFYNSIPPSSTECTPCPPLCPPQVSQQTLAGVSVVFLPLTWLAGIYGTNFLIFPELTWGVDDDPDNPAQPAGWAAGYFYFWWVGWGVELGLFFEGGRVCSYRLIQSVNVHMEDGWTGSICM